MLGVLAVVSQPVSIYSMEPQRASLDAGERLKQRSTYVAESHRLRRSSSSAARRRCMRAAAPARVPIDESIYRMSSTTSSSSTTSIVLPRRASRVLRAAIDEISP